MKFLILIGLIISTYALNALALSTSEDSSLSYPKDTPLIYDELSAEEKAYIYTWKSSEY